MIYLIALSLLFFISSAQAVVHYFDLGDITAKGKVTSYPSSLGWIEPGFSFSASASMLEQKSFDFNSASFGTSTEPLGIKPTLIASGLGQTWGGWSMVVVNKGSQISSRSQGTTLVAGDSSDKQDKFDIKTNNLGVVLGTGKRLSDNWSIGWSLSFFQIDRESHSLSLVSSSLNKSLTVETAKSKLVGANVGMGFIFDQEGFAFGMHLNSPSVIVKNTGLRESQSIDLQTKELGNNISEEKVKFDNNNFATEVGVRFGKEGFVYLVSDEFSFSGSHKINIGFEHVSSWGTIASGYSHFDYDQVARDKALVGFAKTKGNFKWAVGPYLESELLKGDSGYNSRSLGVLYTSEIQY